MERNIIYASFHFNEVDTFVTEVYIFSFIVTTEDMSFKF